MRPRGWGFLYQRFSSLLPDEACQFRNQQNRTAVKFGVEELIGRAARGIRIVEEQNSRTVASACKVKAAGTDGHRLRGAADELGNARPLPIVGHGFTAVSEPLILKLILTRSF